MIRIKQQVKRCGVLAIMLGIAVCVSGLVGCSTPERATPKLAVVMVVDMMPGDFLDRFRGHFGEGGFKRLADDGAWFRNAHLSYGASMTAPGHATIATGTNPAGHGIVANRWYKANLASPINAVSDDYYVAVGPPHEAAIQGASVHLMDGSTIGDELKKTYGSDAGVWSVSIKAESAVLLGGEFADGVIWWSRLNGVFVSSTAYCDTLPEWCDDLNTQKFADAYFGVRWDRKLTRDAYAIGDVDANRYEKGSRVLWTNTMPKTLGMGFASPNKVYYAQLQLSPYGNELPFELARRAVSYEALGTDDTPDVLFLSLSSPDFCGHAFGPDSHEMLDMFVRTDEQIAQWLEFLDANVGLDQCLITLVADHGVGAIPEYATNLGLDAGRVDLNDVAKTMEDALVERYGSAGSELAYVETIDLPWVYLNETLLKANNVDIDEAAGVAARAVDGTEGVEAAIVSGDVVSRDASSLSPLEVSVRNSVYKDRSGQLFLELKKYWYANDLCAGHGTAHEYDTHIPVVFFGAGIRPGVHDEPIELRDVAPTISQILGINAPSKATGKSLAKSLGL
jgi:predicted AlkP superfamily pyrophosphatase or phosphodiesterase